MATRSASPAEPGPGPVPPSVMLLSVWQGQDANWHARVVLPDAAAHEFDSPFELARFLSRLPAQRGEAPAPAGGLR